MNIQQQLESGLSHHQAGRLAEAEALYRRVLAQQADNSDALHLLGIMAGQIGRRDAAVDLIRQAIAICSTNAHYHSNLGNALQANGQLDQAIASYQMAIRLKPDLAEAHNNLGNVLQSKGQLDESLAAYRQAIALRPNFVEAHNNLGIVFKDKGQHDEAIAAFRQAIALRPGYAEAHSNLGNALRDKGQLDDSIAACRQAIGLNPNLHAAYNNLGNSLKDQGQLDEAIAAYRLAIRLKPDYDDAHYNLATLFMGIGKLDEAIAAYQQAIRFKPDLADAHSNLGNVFKDNGQFDEAIASHRQAVRLQPDNAETHDSLIGTCNYHPACDAGMIHAELRRWNERHAEPHKKLIRPHHNNRDPSRPLRIGYVSADFYKHASAFFLLPLFRCHDRRQFELFGYSHGNCSDEVTQQMKDHMQHWRTTVGMTDAQAAAQVRQDQIDILVDLKLHTADNHLLLFAQKPAPVQATWLGYPGSTGMDAIDYRLTDPYLDPPGQNDAYYSERSIHLPDTFWCYDPLSGEPSVNAPPCVENGFITFGCLNNFCKINDAVLSLWAGVLQTVSGSRLLLMAPEGSARERVMARLIRDGIGSGRVEFVPKQFRSGYLTTYHRIDISLDTFPYNGHTTSLDSLWMGVPVITLVGATAFGRAGLSQLTNLGLTELVARTPEQYIQIAADLAKDLPRLTELRRTLRPRMQASPLMDAPRFARNVEAAYRQMWRNWCAQGANPE
jgi:predicted O-linked N-acetylglucosamine transferase (SPINDLY family)